MSDAAHLPPPFPEAFETPRLLIRCPLPGDGPAVNAAIVQSLDRLRPWLPWARRPVPTVEETRVRLLQNRAEFLDRVDLPFLLFFKETGAFIGGSGLHRIDWEVPKFEIGYWIRTGWEGQGLMTEAAGGIANFAFDTLHAHRVEIRCNTENTRSAAVAVRLGFTLEGILRHDGRDAYGHLRDTAVYAQVR